MARQMVTRDVWEVQGCYEAIHGFESVAAEDSRKEAQDVLAVYRQNEKGVPFRIVKKREKL